MAQIQQAMAALSDAGWRGEKRRIEAKRNSAPKPKAARTGQTGRRAIGPT